MSVLPAQERRLRWLVWSLTAAYAICLLIMTHLPPARVPRVRVTDEVLHFVTYVILAMLLLWSLRYVRSMRASGVWVILAVMIFGAIDEITQPLVGRTASVNDWLSDAAGAVTGVAVVLAMTALRDAWRR
jgi:VanZ family protein